MLALGDFIDTLAACRTTASVGQVFAGEITRHGYTSSVCNTAIPGENARLFVYFRNWRPDWASYDASTNFSARSPIPAAARKHARPFSWRSIRANPALTRTEVNAFGEAEDFGWHDGLVVPIHGPSGRTSLVSMATGARDIDTTASAERRMAALAHLTFQRCDELEPVRQPPAVEKLTPRGLECLQWVAAGKTDFEIGMIIGVSQVTVKFHIEQARARLGAATRAQAVAIIALAGLL